MTFKIIIFCDYLVVNIDQSFENFPISFNFILSSFVLNLKVLNHDIILNKRFV